MVHFNLVNLITSDNKEIHTTEEVVERSTLIKSILERMGGPSSVPVVLPRVSARVMWKVLKYLEHHRGEPINANGRTNATEWDKSFIIVNLNQGMLLDIIKAADYLDIKSLLDAAAQTVTLDTIYANSPGPKRVAN